jgi:hypothetical protein
MTGCRQTSSEYFPKTVEKTTQKNGYWKAILLSCLRFMGKHFGRSLGAIASLETGLGGEVSGAKIGVGQFLVAPGEIGGRSGPRL